MPTIIPNTDHNLLAQVLDDGEPERHANVIAFEFDDDGVLRDVVVIDNGHVSYLGDGDYGHLCWSTGECPP
jgi:hypothetical protein